MVKWTSKSEEDLNKLLDDTKMETEEEEAKEGEAHEE